jgi:hypothetical protein
MKTLILILCMVPAIAMADDQALTNGGTPSGFPETIQVQRVPYGSGTPQAGVTTGYDVAQSVGSGLYAVPSYLPYEPTGVTMYPRVVQVPCSKTGTEWKCAGYAITPGLGRGEYILIQPVLQK